MTTVAQSTTDEQITIDEAIARSSPKQAKAFRKIRDALDDAADSYSAEVTYEHTCKDSSSVVISSSDNYWREGELGLMRFRITIGAHGGLKSAESRDVMTDREHEFVAERPTIRSAWTWVLREIGRAP